MTSSLKWTEKFSVENKLLDDHHKKLFNIIYDIEKVFSDEEMLNDEKLKPLLSELVNYADYHFKSEEAYLEQMKYTNLDAHKLQHEIFQMKVKSFFDQVTTFGNSNTSKRILDYLKMWLTEHIMIEDAEYAKFIKLSRAI